MYKGILLLITGLVIGGCALEHEVGVDEIEVQTIEVEPITVEPIEIGIVDVEIRQVNGIVYVRKSISNLTIDCLPIYAQEYPRDWHQIDHIEHDLTHEEESICDIN